MSITKYVFGQDLKEQLLEGVKKLNHSVSSTLGPGGRTVLIRNSIGESNATKDGVTVAKAFSRLESDIEDIGAKLVRRVSMKCGDEAGDGTTTSVLLSSVMIEEGLRATRQGSNPVEVKAGIDKTVNMIVEELKKMSMDISSEDQIKQVATISANNDAEIGELIYSAVEKVGREGVITIEHSKTGETTLEAVEGMQINRGYASPYFITDQATTNCVLEDVIIMVYDGKIMSAQELLAVLTKANAQNKSLLIIADDYGDEALATLVVNKMRGIVKLCAVKAPEYGDRKSLILEDIATICGAQVISKDKGLKLDKMQPNQLEMYLGHARTITATRDETTIVDGDASSEEIEKRANELKKQIEKFKTFWEKEHLQQRLGKMVGGVAVISVGGNSEIEIRERKDRVEDSMMATRAALSDGVIPGGGIALINAVEKVKSQISNWDSDHTLGFKIVEKACWAPFKKILENSGIDNNQEIYVNIKEKKKDFENPTYDAKKREVVDAFKSGLIDPTKVTITALKNGSSVAGTVLTTESVIFEEREDHEKPRIDSQANGYYQ